ncbi:hypothetical protein [Sinorhizobium meliloti]|uniref:hypothetical protein n=1 Tax=Rhizobium meliloti TaxID=382 RepID=UPI000FDA21F2|nr:hypothetical protein [Sinorhizobium meliloti]RVK37616.1 hypothetical protein CN163_15905 [Sinorhizobium meliloti]
MGRMSVIPGTSAISIPGAPKITMTDFERSIANLPGLRHVIDPEKLDVNCAGRDRFSGAIIAAKNTAVMSRIASDATFNNLPVVQINDATGGLRLAPGTVTESLSFVSVAMITSAARAEAAGHGLLNVTNGAGTYKQSFRTQNAGSLYFYADNSGNRSTITSANFPAGDQVGIWGFSYDAETKQSGVLYGGGESISLWTHDIGPTNDLNDRYNYGGSDGSLGWVGKLGMALIFERAMHLPTMLPFFQSAVSLLKGRYGLS